jgi:hypothetical protein
MWVQMGINRFGDLMAVHHFVIIEVKMRNLCARMYASISSASTLNFNGLLTEFKKSVLDCALNARFIGLALPTAKGRAIILNRDFPTLHHRCITA